MKTKMKVCTGLLAALSVLPTGAQAAFSINSDTGMGQLNYLENQKRAARENALTEDEKQLLADSKEIQKQQTQQVPPGTDVPVALEGDELFYDERTGEVYVKGNVVITQLQERLITDEANGNIKTKDVEVPGKARMLDLTRGHMHVRLDGYETKYNYGTQTGTMDNPNGKVGNKYVTGQKIEFFPDKKVIYKGTATKCGAKSPHYHISAEKIEIWPNEKMVMHNANFWLGKTCLYHRDRYETRLDGKDDDPVYPRVGYDSDDGFWISQNFSVPLARKVSADTDIRYLSRHGMMNEYNLRWSNGGASYRLAYGNYEDSDSHWIKKTPSFIWSYGHRIGDTPFKYSLGYEIGKWYNNGIHSTHKKYSISLSRDTIILPGRWRWSNGIGYSITDESYDDSRSKGFSWASTFLKDFDDRWSAYAGYRYSHSNRENSLFAYDTADYAQKIETGFSYRFSDKDRLAIGVNYDLKGKEIRDVDYYWFHDLHCAQMLLRYRGKRNIWNISFEFAPW